MSEDLNDFLRQAALRREARKRQASSASGPVNPSPNAASQSRRGNAGDDELEVLEPIPVAERHLTPQIPAADHLAGNVAKADRLREAHLQEVFGNKPVPLDRSPNKKSKAKGNPQPTKSAPSSAPASPTQFTISAPMDEIVGPPTIRKVVSAAEVIAMLRNPSSLKLAFIASEIFGRKFQ